MLEVVICSVCYEFVILCFFSSFTSPYVFLLKIILLIPLEYNITRETGIADYYNIILLRLNLEVHIFHCSRGGRLAALVGVCIVWNLEPLASGGQSGHKLIPHIVCENKVPFWDFKEFAVTHEYALLPLLFVIITINSIPRKYTGGNKFSKSKEKFNGGHQTVYKREKILDT